MEAYRAELERRCSNSDGIAFAIETVISTIDRWRQRERSNSDGIAFAIETRNGMYLYLYLSLLLQQ